MAEYRQGLSIHDIEARFEVSRRTAERMRDAVIRAFPSVEETRDDSRIKRWYLPRTQMHDLSAIDADDLAALQTAIRLADTYNIADTGQRLAELEAKLNTLIDRKKQERIAPDLEAITEAEGLAVRQGPRPKIDTGHIEELRYAIKACRAVEITYTARSTGRTSWQHIHPYGFIYGSRHYLVAYSPEQEDFRLYSLPNIHAVDLQDTSFERDSDFDLQAYANRSFGVFQEEPVNVVWQVSPGAAEDARHYLFHPSQQIEEQDDGSLLIHFTAGGMLEMCWELFRWGGSIQIIAPDELKALYAQTLNQRKE